MTNYYFSKTLAMVFFMACFGALMNPPPYILIGVIFLLMGLVLLPETSKLTQQKLNWTIRTKVKTLSILLGFMVICLVVPQVNLDTTPFSTNYLEQPKNIKQL